MSIFQKFIESREDDANIPANAKEAKREIQIVANDSLGTKINGFGIEEINFELIDFEEAKQGIQLNMEAKGPAIAKSKQHISSMLQKLSRRCREPLWKKKIFLDFMYHQIDVTENVVENDDNTPIGLKKTLYFTVICAAIVFR